MNWEVHNCTWLVINKTVDFLRSQTVMYIAPVVISRKLCKMQTCYYKMLIGSDIQPTNIPIASVI